VGARERKDFMIDESPRKGRGGHGPNRPVQGEARGNLTPNAIEEIRKRSGERGNQRRAEREPAVPPREESTRRASATPRGRMDGSAVRKSNDRKGTCSRRDKKEDVEVRKEYFDSCGGGFRLEGKRGDPHADNEIIQGAKNRSRVRVIRKGRSVSRTRTRSFRNQDSSGQQSAGLKRKREAGSVKL